jgi:hypothetical protein
MPDLNDQIRTYFDEVDPPFTPAELMREPQRTQHPRRIMTARAFALAAGAAVAVLVLVGGPLLLLRGATDVDGQPIAPVVAQTNAATTPKGVPVAPLPVVVEPDGVIVATTVAKQTPPIATCPPGSNPNLPGPVDQARPLQGHDFLAAMDRQSGRVIAVDYPGVDTWAFDVCTNTWTRVTRLDSYPQAEPSALVYDADSGLIVAIGAFVDAYDADTNAWKRNGETPFGRDGDARAVYDPVSGLIVARDIASSEMWAYNVDTDTWTPIRQGPISPPGTEQRIESDVSHNFFAQLHAYDADTDRIVLYLTDNYSSPGDWEGLGTEMTWTFDLRASEWTIEDTVTPELAVGSWVSPPGKAAYDETARRTVITGVGVVGGYDSARHEWEILWENPPSERAINESTWTGLHNRFGDTIVYDPTNDRIIVIGGDARMPNPDRAGEIDWISMNDVWAFNTSTGTWSELLAPSTP